MAMMKGLDDMYLFTVVVECRGFAAASRHVRLPKSTLARRIANLERQLKVPLFHRGARPFSLTNFGAECYAQCIKMVSEANEVMSLADRTRTTPAGSLKIICPALLSELFVEQLVAEFAVSAKGVRVHLEVAWHMLDPRSAACDLIIYPAFEPLPASDLVARKLYVAEYVLVAAPAIADQIQSGSMPDILKKCECLGLGARSADWTWHLTNREGKEYVLKFEPRFATTQLSALHRAAVEGLGVAALPRELCSPDLRAGRLVRILPEWQPSPATIFAIYPSGRSMTAAARHFLDMLIERFPRAVKARRR